MGWNGIRFNESFTKGLFGKRFLIMLFKCFENTCGGKSVVEICVIVFKQRKLLFKQQYQTDPKTLKIPLYIQSFILN